MPTVSNHDKTECVIFSNHANTSQTSPLLLNSKPLKFSSCFKHLGHLLSQDLNDCSDIDRSRNSFTKRSHIFLSRFSALSPLLKARLFHPFCCSFYGASLWDLSSAATMNAILGNSGAYIKNNLSKSFMYSLRRTWGLPKNSIKDITHLVCQQPPIYRTLCLNQLKFLQKQIRILTSHNPVIKLCWKLSLDHNLFLFRSCAATHWFLPLPPLLCQTLACLYAHLPLAHN